LPPSGIRRACAVETTQSQAIEFQEAFEVGKQHFHLLAIAPGLLVSGVGAMERGKSRASS